MKIDGYAELVKLMRKQGAVKNPPQTEIATIKSTAPLVLLVSGTEISSGIYVNPLLIDNTLIPALEDASLSAFLADVFNNLRLSAGDLVAVKRSGENNIILSKLVSV